MTEIREMMSRIEGRFDAIDERLDRGFAGILQSLDNLGQSVDGLGERIDGTGIRLGASLDGLELEVRRLRTTVLTLGSIPYVAALGVAIVWIISLARS